MNLNTSALASAQWSLKRRLAIYALATFIPVAGILLGLEGAGRAYIYIKYHVPGKSYGLWRYDETIGARHREDAYNTQTQTNNFGFRNQEAVIQPKPTNSLRVITYGGSTTFCYNLPDSETWPDQLQRALRKSTDSRYQVLNAGAIMWSLGHAYARATVDIPSLRPDYVLIYSGINEHANAEFLAADGESMKLLVQNQVYGRFATNLDQNRWLKRNLVTVRILDYLVAPWIRSLRSAESPANTKRSLSPGPSILKNYLHVLNQFIDLIHSNGARAIFIIQAHDGRKERNEYLTSYSRSGAALALSKSAIVVDASKLIDTYEGNPSDLFYSSGVHYSSIGAQKLAELLNADFFSTLATHEH